MTVTSSLAFTGGPVISMDPDYPVADTLLIEGERIGRVGLAADLAEGLRTAKEVIELRGRAVLPGFIDTHAHVIATGLAHFTEDLTAVHSLARALTQLIAAAAEMLSGEWLVAYGLTAGLLRDERRLPTRVELDSISDRSPIFVGERTGHACALNSAGLALLNLHPGTEGFLQDGEGEPLGVLVSTANTLASDKTDLLFARQIGYDRVVKAACEEALRSGLTTLHALDGAQPANDPGVIALYAHGERGTPGILVYYQTRDVDAVLRLGLPRLGGCGACWVDGAFTPHTARLLEPYTDQPGTFGTLYFEDEELRRLFREAHRASLQISVHCVGDGAVEQALSAYEVILAEHPRPDHRHRIEHAELITRGQLDRARRLDIAFAIQPSFNHFWQHDEFYPSVIGPERAARVDPVRTLVDAGLLVAGGSDSPVTPLRPLLGVHSAVNHSNPAERVDILTAVRLFTANAARIGFEENDKGALTPGKLADMVVLGANPLLMPPGELKDIPVEMTVVRGEVAYASS